MILLLVSKCLALLDWCFQCFIYRRLILNIISRLKSFEDAIDNECLLDLHMYSLLNVNPLDFFYLPKVGKWYQRVPVFLKKHKKFSRIIFLLLSFIIIILGWIYIVYDFLVSLSIYKTAKISSCSIAFVNGDRNFEVVKDTVHDNNECMYISARPLSFKVNENFAVVDNCMGVTSKIKSLFLSFLVYGYFFVSLKFRCVLQCYSAYRFFLVQEFFITRRPDEIITSHHYDRWAILIDRFVAEFAAVKKIKFTLIQHGLERADFLNEIHSFGFFKKISNINFLWVYSEDQSKLFLNYIVDNSLTDNITVRVLSKKRIVLDEIFDDNKVPKILFIGHPVYDEIQYKLYKSLVERYSVHCYYKPHPTTMHDIDRLRQCGWTVVEDNSFPNVDFYVSYYSTLAIQYDEAGKTGFIHGEGSGSDFFNEVSKMIYFFQDKLPIKE